MSIPSRNLGRCFAAAAAPEAVALVDLRDEERPITPPAPRAGPRPSSSRTTRSAGSGAEPGGAAGATNTGTNIDGRASPPSPGSPVCAGKGDESGSSSASGAGRRAWTA